MNLLKIIIILKNIQVLGYIFYIAEENKPSALWFWEKKGEANLHVNICNYFLHLD
jgi:hypothetical protein